MNGGRSNDYGRTDDGTFYYVMQRADETDAKTSGREPVSGTPLYMSPEQASSYEDVDGRADI